MLTNNYIRNYILYRIWAKTFIDTGVQKTTLLGILVMENVNSFTPTFFIVVRISQYICMYILEQ